MTLNIMIIITIWSDADVLFGSSVVLLVDVMMVEVFVTQVVVMLVVFIDVESEIEDVVLTSFEFSSIFTLSILYIADKS